MSLDQPLPITVSEPSIQHIEQEPDDMGALPIGSTTRIPDIEGRWSVWSQSSESPGAHFLIPFDEKARELGVKYIVVRAKISKNSVEPILTVIRSDPYVKGLCG